jgi:hypothetical protein
LAAVRRIGFGLVSCSTLPNVGSPAKKNCIIWSYVSLHASFRCDLQGKCSFLNHLMSFSVCLNSEYCLNVFCSTGKLGIPPHYTVISGLLAY